MSFHARNRHQGHYDLDALKFSSPEFAPYVIQTKYGKDSINFSDPDSVRALNRALLLHYYRVQWDLPKSALCPPIPGRADYIHHLADLIGLKREARILDVGVGTNCIYPILGVHEYQWHFVGSDVNPLSIKSAQKILESNPSLSQNVELRLQKNPKQIFEGIISDQEHFTATMCNPPFHASKNEAVASTNRKLTNLNHGKMTVHRKSEPLLNFGGEGSELWCEGGELAFIQTMIEESVIFSKNCEWFTTLVSKSENLPKIEQFLKKAKVKEVKQIEMSQGQKKSRIMAWTF